MYEKRDFDILFESKSLSGIKVIFPGFEEGG